IARERAAHEAQCPAGSAAIDGAASAADALAMCRLTSASARKVAVIVPAISRKYWAAPASSAGAPRIGLKTPPMRPNATAVPTPVDRIEVGYTCAASAYIVVC